MGRVDDVERLLQVLAVLRAAERRAVPREELQSKVIAYARSTADLESIKKMIRLDVEEMNGMGFRIENVAPPGADSEYVLHEGSPLLPVDLDPGERSLLAWAMAAAGATAADDGMTSLPMDLSVLLGALPRALDAAQSALASGRSLSIVWDGEAVDFRPAMLAARHGRWFLLGCFGDDTTVKAPHLDRIEVLGLGPPMESPVVVEDPDVVLDPTAWPAHEPRDAVIACRSEDLGAVTSWFPRAEVTVIGEQAELRFWYRKEESLVSRVIGLAGSAWIVSPPSAVEALRDQVEAVLT